MKVFIILFSCMILLTAEERVMKVFDKGVENLTYTNAFWLVSPPVMTDLLSAYSLRTNYQLIIDNKNKIINALTINTNLDLKYINMLELEVKKYRKESGKAVLFTVGGFTVGIGLTALIYHIAGTHIKEINKE